MYCADAEDCRKENLNYRGMSFPLALHPGGIFRFLAIVFRIIQHIVLTAPHRTALILLAVLLCVIWPTLYGVAQPPETKQKKEILLDATWVPCSDSTESLYLFQDGSAIYAEANNGILFTVGETTLKNVAEVLASMKSTVDTATLDSCTTVGVILNGPRYLLVNSANPSPDTKPLRDQLDVLQQYARRKISRDIERARAQIQKRPNPGVKTDPALDPDTLQQYIYKSPIAARWRCRGTVVVTAQVDARGNVRRAFAADADVEGKCSSLLVMTAIRAVTLSSFEPAIKIEGTTGAAWMNIIVTFGRTTVTSEEEGIGR